MVPPVTSTNVLLDVPTLVTVPVNWSVEAIVIVLLPLSVIVTLEPAANVKSPSREFNVFTPVRSAGNVAQVLSPRKYVVALGVPVALSSAVTVTLPSVAVFGVKSINVPSVVVTVSTMLVGTVGIVGNVCNAPVPSIYWDVVPAPVTVKVPDVVTGEFVTVKAVGIDKPTLVTVPGAEPAVIEVMCPVAFVVIDEGYAYVPAVPKLSWLIVIEAPLPELAITELSAVPPFISIRFPSTIATSIPLSAPTSKVI